MSCVVAMMRRGTHQPDAITEDSTWLKAFHYVPVLGDLFTWMTLHNLGQSASDANRPRQIAVARLEEEYCGIGVIRHILSLVGVVAARYFGAMGNELSLICGLGSFTFIWFYAYGCRIQDRIALAVANLQRLERS